MCVPIVCGSTSQVGAACAALQLAYGSVCLINVSNTIFLLPFLCQFVYFFCLFCVFLKTCCCVRNRFTFTKLRKVDLQTIIHQLGYFHAAQLLFKKCSLVKKFHAVITVFTSSRQPFPSRVKTKPSPHHTLTPLLFNIHHFSTVYMYKTCHRLG
jgi:hypothetical protein